MSSACVLYVCDDIEGGCGHWTVCLLWRRIALRREAAILREVTQELTKENKQDRDSKWVMLNSPFLKNI